MILIHNSDQTFLLLLSVDKNILIEEIVLTWLNDGEF